ncbi:MAG: slipin family protein [Planctomycetota bacterium]|jgi:regulator of protease activity HflC (stomatin/prohibitin superfamily)
MNFVSLITFVIVGAIGAATYFFRPGWEVPFVFLPLAVIASLSPQVLNQWDRGIVLRLGRFRRQIGPGLYWIIPLLDRMVRRVDQRVMTNSFLAEKALTRDTVPVNVDAVLFWHVWDAEKATLEVANYTAAVSWAAQTALRDMIGRTVLASLLSEREELDKQLQAVIDSKTEPWGITVQSVEIRDVVIPESLQDAMSRQAQAERERQARIILGDAENQIAQKFVEAAHKYDSSESGLHLRAMNILYESLKEKGTMVIVPSSAVDSMGLGGMAGLTAFARQSLDGARVGPMLGGPPALPKGAEAEAEEELFGQDETGEERGEGNGEV